MSCQGRDEGGGSLHDDDTYMTPIRPSRLTLALGLKKKKSLTIHDSDISHDTGHDTNPNKNHASVAPTMGS